VGQGLVVILRAAKPVMLRERTEWQNVGAFCQSIPCTQMTGCCTYAG
jgi:hypothetical protein